MSTYYRQAGDASRGSDAPQPAAGASNAAASAMPPWEPFDEALGADEGAMHDAAKPVLLAPDELPELRRRGQLPSGRLHDEAREWLNAFADIDAPPVGAVGDLTAEWRNWKMYIATHKDAERVIGPVVVSFTAEFIDGVTDPNRGGRPRLDLVVRHSDGGYVRLHPGSKPSNDAKPRFFPGSAAEPAADEWRTPGADGIFLPDRARLVPQGDKLGKQTVWHTVQALRAQGLIPDEQGGSSLDITDGAHLRWWLWICNLAAFTWRVIGPGVCSAHVAMNGDDEAVFTFTRTDDTECSVRLCCNARGTGRELKVFVSSAP